MKNVIFVLLFFCRGHDLDPEEHAKLYELQFRFDRKSSLKHDYFGARVNPHVNPLEFMRQ